MVTVWAGKYVKQLYSKSGASKSHTPIFESAFARNEFY